MEDMTVSLIISELGKNHIQTVQLNWHAKNCMSIKVILILADQYSPNVYMGARNPGLSAASEYNAEQSFHMN